MSRPAFLCADDYALTEGVSRGIEDLAEAGRLSGTSALVTTRHWTGAGRRVRDLRQRIAVGLHLNITLGAPLGPMKIAAGGRLPAIGDLVRLALLGRVDAEDIAAETSRQVAKFVEVAGTLPDFVDGHQHAHALPGVRDGVLIALQQACGGRRMVVRDPSDSPARIFRRGAAVPKSLVLATLARGFGAAVRRAGFLTNDGFSGVSSFARDVPYATELARFLGCPGPDHLVMCHPGHPDAELAALDPVVERRADEFEAIAAYPGLPDLIRHREPPHEVAA